MKLHVSDKFLGATLVSSRGDRRTIMACWLEESEGRGLRPTFVALVAGDRDGEMFKVNLPDPDWSMWVPS